MLTPDDISRLIGHVLHPEETRILQMVFARIVAEGRLPDFGDDQRDFAAYLIKMYFRGLVIEEKLYSIGVAAAKARFGDRSTFLPEDFQLSLTSVLVVEDDYLLAKEIRDAFENAGARVLGPASRTGQALLLLENDIPDMAIIDLNLGEGPKFEVAEHLRRQSVPVCICTAYKRVDFNNLPESLSSSPWFEKPVHPRALLGATARALR